jgi:hypothetical protein
MKVVAGLKTERPVLYVLMSEGGWTEIQVGEEEIEEDIK